MMTLPLRTLGVALAGMSIVVLGPIQQSLAAPAPANLPLSALTQAQPTRHVSATFVNAPVQKVLDWLAKQDANFVVSSTTVPANLKLTLHFSNQPLADVEAAIASAMGGSWHRENGILVFSKGFRSPVFINGQDFKAFGPDGQMNFDPKMFKELKEFKGPDGKEFKFEFDKQFGPDFQKKMQDQFGPEFQERMQKQFGPDFQKKMQDQFGPDFQKKMEDKFGPEFQLKIQKEFGPEFQKKLQDEIQQAQRQAEKAQAEAMKSQKDMLKSQTDVLRAQELALRAQKMGQLDDARAWSTQNLKGLQDSFTDSQRDTLKSRGYLKLSELSEKQRKMLGEVNGTFEIAFSNDKGSFRIKSD